MIDREVDADAAAHRVPDDVDLVQAERVDESGHRRLCVQHGMAAEVVAHPESGELQHQAPVVLREEGQVAAEVAPAGDSRPGSVQQQQGGAFAGLVVAQNALLGGDLALGAFVRRVHGCYPTIGAGGVATGCTAGRTAMCADLSSLVGLICHIILLICTGTG
jgi:hypothetical protein